MGSKGAALQEWETEPNLVLVVIFLCILAYQAVASAGHHLVMSRVPASTLYFREL